MVGNSFLHLELQEGFDDFRKFEFSLKMNRFNVESLRLFVDFKS